MDGSSDESSNYDSPENARIVVIVLWRLSRTLSCNHWYVTLVAHCTCLSALSVFGEKRPETYRGGAATLFTGRGREAEI